MSRQRLFSFVSSSASSVHGSVQQDDGRRKLRKRALANPAVPTMGNLRYSIPYDDLPVGIAPETDHVPSLLPRIKPADHFRNGQNARLCRSKTLRRKADSNSLKAQDACNLPHELPPELTHLRRSHNASSSSLKRQHHRDRNSTYSTAASIRSYAKTPVFAIGDLEKKRRLHAKHVERHVSALETSCEDQKSWETDKQVYELPAEPVSRRETFRKRKSELPPALPPDLIPARIQSLTLHPKTALRHRPSRGKVLPRRPDRQPPDVHLEHPPGYRESEQIARRDLGMDICMYLLTQELSAATAFRPDEQGSALSLLEVWLLIEAYEALGAQLRSEAARVDEETAAATELMLKTWLRALYIIYEHLRTQGRRLEL